MAHLISFADPLLYEANVAGRDMVRHAGAE